jgi:hypothetical protein
LAADAGEGPDALKTRIEAIRRNYADLNNYIGAALDAQRNVQKAKLGDQFADLESRKKRELVTDVEYFRQKRDLQLDDLNAEIAYTKKRADAASSKADQSERTRLLGQVKILEQERVKVTNDADRSIAESRTATAKVVSEQARTWKSASEAEKAALAEETAGFGKSAEARRIASEQLKVESELRQFLAAQAKAGRVLSDDEIKDLRAQAKARQDNIAAIQGQRQALAGAEQLREQNKRFAAEYIMDEQAKAAYLLKIDDDYWQERIQLAGDGTEAQKRLQEDYSVWYANQSAKPMLDAQRNAVKQYSDVFRNGFVDMLNNGKSAWSSFTKSLVTTFKTTVADQLYKMLAQPFVMKVIGNLVGVNAATSAATTAGANAVGAGASSMLTGAAGAGAAYTAYQSSYLGQFMSGYSGSAAAASQALGAPMTTAAQAGSYMQAASPYLSVLGGGLSAYTYGEKYGALGGAAAGVGSVAAGGAMMGALGGTGAAAGAMGALAAVPVWGWVAIAALSILGGMQDGPEKNTRLTFTSNNTPGNISINERGNEGKVNQSYIDGYGTGAFGTFGLSSTFWMDGRQDVVQQFIKSVTAVDDALSGFLTTTEKDAVKAGITGKSFTAATGAESDNPNAKGQLDAVFSNRMNAIFESVTPGLSALISEFKGTTQELASEAATILQFRQALGDAGEAVFGAKVTLQDVAALKLPSEATGAALQRVTAEFKSTNVLLDAMGITGRQAFGAVGLASEAARKQLVLLAGGADALASQSGAFANAFLSLSERLAPARAEINRQLAELGYSNVTTVEQYKEAVMSLVRSGALASEQGAKTYASLLQLAGAFKELADASDELEKNRAALQIRIMELEGNAAGALAEQRKRELAQMDAALRPLQQRVYALQDEQNAMERAKAAATSLLSGVDEAFSVLQKVVERDRAAATAAHDAQVKAIQAGIDATTAKLNKLNSLSQLIESTMDQLREPGQMVSAATRQAAQAQIQAAVALAKAGGALPDADAIKDALSIVTKDASSQFSTYTDYLRDFYTTANDVSELGAIADNQVSVAEQQLKVLQQQKDAADAAFQAEMSRLDQIIAKAQEQVDALKGINTTLGTLAAALSGLSAAMAAAQANPMIGATGAIGQAYQSALGRAPDAAGLAFWQQQAVNGASTESIVNNIKNSNEAQIRSLYKTVLGREVDAQGYDFWMKAANSGQSIDSIKQQIQNSDEYKSKYPGFAGGGTHFGGARIVGEFEPELEVTGPARIWNGRQMADALRGGGLTEDLLAEIRAQRADNASLRQSLEAHLYAIAKNTMKTADIQETWETIGPPGVRTE